MTVTDEKREWTMTEAVASQKADESDSGSTRWHCVDADDVIQSMDTDVASGLSVEEAARRLQDAGPNVFKSTDEARWYRVLGRQFIDVLILILLVAAAVSVIVGELADALTILAIIALNGTLGFVQEWKAERALKALRGMLSPRCHVVREGREREVAARTLVPGDVVRLETGDRVPADLRIVECTNLKIDESALTGESLSVSKRTAVVAKDVELAEQSSMAWMGTAATNGRAVGVVVRTGEGTEFGRIASLTESIGRETTPLQRKLGKLGKQLGIVAILISVMVSLAGWAMGETTLGDVPDRCLSCGRGRT